MYTSFYIKKHRLDELKKHIREHLPTVRFRHNPLEMGNEWFIALDMDVKDSAKLNELHNKWHDEDQPKPEPKKSILDRFKQLFK